MSIQYTSDQLERKFSGSPSSPGFARQADGLRLEGRLDEAIELCQNGLRSRPTQLSGYLVLGKAFIDKDNLELAREQFEAAIKIDPRCLSALHFLAQIMNNLQSGALADGYYHSILELDPWDGEIKGLLADTHSSTYLKKGSLVPLSVPYIPEQTPSETMPSLGELAPVKPSDEMLDAVYPEGETFEKPEGLTGDVMEISLNEPNEINELEPLDGLGILDAIPSDAMSLEDALSIQPSQEEHHLNEPPISGQDVTDRLDSIFGFDDDVPVISVTPAMSASSAIPVFVDFPKINDDSDTKTADLNPVADLEFDNSPTIQMKSVVSLSEAMDLDYDPAATVVQARTQLEPEHILELPIDSFKQLETQTQFMDVETETTEIAAETSALAAETSRLAAETNIIPVEAAQGQISGVDVEKRLDDLFSLDTKAEDDFSEPEVVVEPETITDEDMLASATETHGLEINAPEEMITGENLSDHLDEFFGSDPETSSPILEKAQMPQVEDLAHEALAEKPIDPTDEPATDEFTAHLTVSKASGNVLSTESMLPVTWKVEDGEEELEITGEDIEAQLDKLFAMIGESDEFDPDKVVIKAETDVVTFEDLIPLPKVPEQTAQVAAEAMQTQAIANPETDLTVMMPAIPNSDLGKSPNTKEAGAAETMYISAENSGEFSVDESALILEEDTSLTDTATIEMIDGDDVAGRLDELFSIGESEKIETSGEATTIVAATAAYNAGAEATAEVTITGDEVVSRLSEIFPESPISVVETEVTKIPVTLEDEEDGYPEEESISPDGTGANVATVTLAEIYFQQGLKEQALKIYRQLLELEPGNETVKTRITEIEATKSEGESGEAAKNSSRNNRFGRKFPKRKK